MEFHPFLAHDPEPNRTEPRKQGHLQNSCKVLHGPRTFSGSAFLLCATGASIGDRLAPHFLARLETPYSGFQMQHDKEHEKPSLQHQPPPRCIATASTTRTSNTRHPIRPSISKTKRNIKATGLEPKTSEPPFYQPLTSLINHKPTLIRAINLHHTCVDMYMCMCIYIYTCKYSILNCIASLLLSALAQGNSSPELHPVRERLHPPQQEQVS